MNTYNLRPMWDVLLDIYKEIETICDRIDVRMWVAYGTLLGAVRHQGFIPWDDDFDVMMPRSDYSEFIKCAQRELPSWLKLVSLETERTSTYSWPFAKVKVVDQSVVKRVANETNLELSQGLFVDVFPIDGLPSSSFMMFVFRSVRAIIRRMKMVDRAAWLQRWAQQRSFDKAKFVGIGNDESHDYHKWHYPREWFDSTMRLPFGKTTVPVPVGYKDVLRSLFGDYMKFPPEKDRVPSHQVLR